MVQISEVSCCGTDCTKCGCYGTMCRGCNKSYGKVFHAPKGMACPIYECSVQKKKFANCADCEQLPCIIWKKTKDPHLSEEEFYKTIEDRVKNLKGNDKNGV